MTDQPNKLNINDKAGANKKIPVFALVGKVVSFANNFRPSANGCSKL